MSYYDKIIAQGSNNSTQSSNRTKTIHMGKVVEVLDAHRLRVRIQGLDTKLKNNKLPVCYSLLPLHIHMLPAVGEVVRIILTDTSTPYEERLWIGPVVTHYEYLSGQSYNYGDEVTMTEESIGQLAAPIDRSNYVQSAGVFPAKDAAAYEQKLLGRGNTEITLGKTRVELKAGKHEAGNINKRNNQNPALIQSRISDDGKKTTSLVTADSILLLTHKGNPLLPAIRKEDITDKDLDDAFEEAHPIPFGDVLKTFCELLRSAVTEHAHPESGMPPLKGSALNKLLEFDLESFLSKSVKIN
jgi:hypothetical protein